ncbi:MAG: 3,4-dihydroxy-2-butanone-4-phosphate synthase [Phycisphaeraceae bacterium]|nr:3,4-dihydroxy-2-butanone-4-phosphate synthase [Phycisphaeraceae bacterium]
MHSIPEILADLRAGKMIVLADDEQRENEGDLVCAAEFATPQVINFMIREGRGVLCLSLTGQVCDRLELTPQSSVNTTQRGTAFTVTIDAHERFGLTTGVSAADRAATIRVAIDPQTRPNDLARPGHIQPLRARDGGVLVRPGQTEGSVDLCKLAGLKPAAVIIEVMNEDGSMSRLPDLQELCRRHNLKICSVADVIEYRMRREKLIHRIDSVPFTCEHGQFTLHAYRSVVDPFPHVALTCGDVGQLDGAGLPLEITQPVLVRMHSQNLLGDVFGDIQQPSARTLRASLRMIQNAGSGALVYLRHEGMGRGLLKRLQTLHLSAEQEERAGGPERVRVGRSQDEPGIKPPSNKSDYGIGSQILRDLGIRRMRLITNHPFHLASLEGFGLEICEFVKVEEA